MSTEADITSIEDGVSKDGSTGFKAERGRYHLYVSGGCPFAHRTTICIALKGLEDVISIDNVDPVTDGVNGWQFTPSKLNCSADTVNGKKYLKEVYAMSHPNYKGRITVPVLFDKTTKRIVNNESAQIVRMLTSEFDEFSSTKEKADFDLYPIEKRKDIDELNDWLSTEILYRPYKAIAAETQEGYEMEVTKLFEGMDKAEEILSKKRFLAGSTLTESDIRFFVLLIRFDVAYYSLFKCNKKLISQYEHLWGYVRDIYQTGAVRSTVHMKDIKEIYWTNKKFTSLSKAIPLGPDLDFEEKSNREHVGC